MVSHTVQNSQLPSIICTAPFLVDARTIATVRIRLRPMMMPFVSGARDCLSLAYVS